MPSAAEKVFGLPELLENILLNLEWELLFKLLRPNVTFRNTITSSVKLRRLMHLEFKLSDDESDIIVPANKIRHSVACDLCYQSKLCVRPFGMSPYKPQPERRKVRVDLTIPRTKALSESIIGMKTRLRPRKGRVKGSWRMMKLTHTRIPIEFHFYIHARQGGISDFDYTEKLEFAAGQGNLGELVDELDLIRKRTLDEHKDRYFEGQNPVHRA